LVFAWPDEEFSNGNQKILAFLRRVGCRVCSCVRLLVSLEGDAGDIVGFGDDSPTVSGELGGLSMGTTVGIVGSGHAINGVEKGAMED
jgi:hypothetical protein